MAPPLKPGFVRPPCPRGHAGRILLNGHRGRWNAYHERPSYLCVYGAGKRDRHAFTAPTRPRRPSAHHPHSGESCELCEHVYDRHEGPRTAPNFLYAIREGASVLFDMGEGKSLREAGAEVRRKIHRFARPVEIRRARRAKGRNYTKPKTPEAWEAFVSRSGAVASQYVDAFAPVIIEHYAPTAWPSAISVDSLPLRSSGLRPSAANPAVGAPSPEEAGEVMAAVDQSGRAGRLMALQLQGGKDRISWLNFFGSIPGPGPDWVVADRDPAIEAAVRLRWPHAVYYNCEAHLARNAQEKLIEDGISEWAQAAGASPGEVIDEVIRIAAIDPPPSGATPRGFDRHPLWEALRDAQKTASEWERFVVLVERTIPPERRSTRTWIADNDELIRNQIALHLANPSMPRSTGKAESALVTVRKSLAERARFFRNVGRVNKILGLMRLQIAGLANEVAYAGLLRAYLAGQQGPFAWRSYRDPIGRSSLEELIESSDAAQAAEDLLREAQQRAANQARRMAEVDAELAAQDLPPSRPGRRRRPVGRAHSPFYSTKGFVTDHAGEIEFEWHPTRNGTLDPAEVRGSSHTPVWWLCKRHEPLGHVHEWQAAPAQVIGNQTDCPYCMSRKVCPANSLAALRPDIARWVNVEASAGRQAGDFLPGSGEVLYWDCERQNPAHPPYPQRIAAKTKQGARCPLCSKEERAIALRTQASEAAKLHRRLGRAAIAAAGRTPAEDGHEADGAASPPWDGEEWLDLELPDPDEPLVRADRPEPDEELF